MPCIRHHALDGILDTSTETYGVIYAIYKDPNGQLAPTVYGEFLPPYSAVPALNFNNPAQFSQSLLSQSVCKPIAEDVPEVQLGTWMKIIISKK